MRRALVFLYMFSLESVFFFFSPGWGVLLLHTIGSRALFFSALFCCIEEVSTLLEDIAAPPDAG